MIIFTLKKNLETQMIKTIITGIFIILTVPLWAQNAVIQPGAYRLPSYLPLLKNKKVIVVANHTSLIGQTHLVDTLLKLNVDILRIFSPEHGFRGMAAAGQKVNSGKDEKTGLPIVSLYGSHKKPTSNDLEGAAVIVFDIQDVGVRFYTYISTLQYVMESCAENNIPLIVLDRPNPNGFYIDGPVLKPEFKSFIGMQPVPVVYGMTIGEYAKMLNGEHWLHNGDTCNLIVIKCLNYTHDSLYKLPVPPSPNLPNMEAVYLYPSIGFFEGTTISIGRGTKYPFQVIGAPFFPKYKFSFVPKSCQAAPKPKFIGQRCYALDLRNDVSKILNKKQINIGWLVQFSRYTKDIPDFFKSSFNLLAGNDILKKDLTKMKSEDYIRASWQKDLKKFKAIREKYLLYP